MKKIIIFFILLSQSMNGMHKAPPKSPITIHITLFQAKPAAPFEAHIFCPQCKKTYDAHNESDTEALLYVQACLALHMINKHNIYIV